MSRVHGWPEHLDDYIMAARAREFSYGDFDCALFCADWIQILTGVDYAKQLRGYDSMKDAYRIIGRFGSVQAMVTELTGIAPTHQAFAQRGDIILMGPCRELGEAVEGLGICVGVRSAFPSVKGIIDLPTLSASLCWKFD
jgi:hypothetical protein